MRSVLYFHGFASSPRSSKIEALRPLLKPRGIELNVPDLNVPSFERLDFDAMVQLGILEARLHPPAALVGSSLGALVALSVARRGVRVPLVLIAPALGVGRRWNTSLPEGDPVTVFNFARNADTAIHRAFFHQVAALDVDETPPPARVTILAGTADDTVPFAEVEAVWRHWSASGLVAGSHFIAIDGGDHSLVAYAPAIADAIEEAAHDRHHP